MANKLFQPQDHQGNPVDLITSAAAVTTASGSNVETELGTLKASISSKTICHIADDIAARDVLEGVQKGELCWVLDATADETVTKGAAQYLYTGETWIKTSEAESMDLILQWSAIQGKEAVEAAMAKAHEHVNKELLDTISADETFVTVNGKKLYVGRQIAVLGQDDPIPDDMAATGVILRAVEA